jgi:hypothetical protein
LRKIFPKLGLRKQNGRPSSRTASCPPLRVVLWRPCKQALPPVPAPEGSHAPAELGLQRDALKFAVERLGHPLQAAPLKPSVARRGYEQAHLLQLHRHWHLPAAPKRYAMPSKPKSSSSPWDRSRRRIQTCWQDYMRRNRIPPKRYLNLAYPIVCRGLLDRRAGVQLPPEIRRLF